MFVWSRAGREESMGGLHARQEGRQVSAVLALVLALAAAMAYLPRPAWAQAAEGAASEQETAATGGASADEIETLVAPIVLYPDPMLGLVMQASTQPLQVVQANRFLEQRAKDSSLTPDQDWDPSILGLLNYPKVLGTMNEYLDWTEALGDAVVDQLADVQDAIIDLRWGAYNAGILASNDQQKVVVDGDVIQVMPANPKSISVPEYDPMALLEAIDTTEQQAAEAQQQQEEQAAAEAAPAETAEEAPAETAEPAPAPAAPAETVVVVDQGAMAPAAYPVGTPGYAVGYPPYTGPPIVTYAEPQPSYWDQTATFLGGAVIGGLLGWGISEAFNDNDWGWYDNGWRGGPGYGPGYGPSYSRSTNISGNTVNINRERTNVDIQDRLRQERPARDRDRVGRDRDRVGRDRDRPASLVPTQRPNRDRVAQRPRSGGQDRQVRLPGAGTDKGVAKRAAGGRTAQAKTPRRTAKAATRPAAGKAATRPAAGKAKPALASSDGKLSTVRKQAARGAQSRGGGAHKVTRQQRSGGAVKKASRGGGGGLAAGVHNGSKARSNASRGKASRAKASGGGGGGGGKRGGGRRRG